MTNPTVYALCGDGREHALSSRKGATCVSPRLLVCEPHRFLPFKDLGTLLARWRQPRRKRSGAQSVVPELSSRKENAMTQSFGLRGLSWMAETSLTMPFYSRFVGRVWQESNTRSLRLARRSP